MYNLTDYAAMIADARRVELYTAALQAAIKPGSLVVEVGTGIGVFAVMAAKLGARRVIAIEPNDAIVVARSIACQNGVADRIDFIQGFAKDVSLPEPADVLVSDLRGSLPAATTHLDCIIDARDRLLAPGGTQIPMVDTLCAAVVEVPKLYATLGPSCSAGGCTVNLDALHRFTRNSWLKARFERGEFLTSAEPWARIDYRTIVDPDVDGTVEWSAIRSGTGHGLALWFDALLADGVAFSNAPGEPTTAWGRLFVPWSEPVEIKERDRIRVRVRGHYIAKDYVWRWDTDVWSPDSDETPKARFRQSTFHGEPFVGAKLRKGRAEHVPVLSEAGRIERFVLDSIDGNTANEDIAHRLSVQFPTGFSRFPEALARVADIAKQFSKS